MVGSKYIEPFKPSEIKQLAKIIGNAYTGSELTELFENSNLNYQHDGTTKWRFLKETFKKLQNKPDGSLLICKFVQTACDPIRKLECKEEHKYLLDSINELFGFHGLKVNDESQIIQISDKQTSMSSNKNNNLKLFDERNYHDQIILNGKDKFIHEYYFDAIDECCKAFEKYVAKKSKSTESGFKLMSNSLSKKKKLWLNSQNTTTEVNQQDGLMHMCMGLMKGIRNPLEHEPQLGMDWNRDDTLDILHFMSYLFKQIDKTKHIDDI